MTDSQARLSRAGRLWMRLLRVVFPRAFRDRFGHDFENFLAQQREEMRYAGWFGAPRFWIDVTGDAVRSALSLRVDTVNRRRPSPRQPRRIGIWTDAFRQDLRVGVRTLRRAPMYTIVSVITLALGIGANSAMFAVVHDVLLRPLPYSDAHQLVMVFHATPTEDRSSMSYLDFHDYAEQNSALRALGGWTETDGTLTGDRAPQQLQGLRISADVMPLLGVQPLLGRFIAAEEDVPGGPRVVILSHGLWKTRYGADSTVIGSIATIDGRAHEIIGVMPAGFTFPDAQPVFWVPLRRDELLREVGIANPDRDLSFITGIGRLAPGTSVQQATKTLSELALRVQATEHPNGKLIGINVVDMQEWLVGATKTTLLTLLGAVSCVLAIACVNVANLTIGRTASRLRELTLRRALGAGPMRVTRQLLTEGVLLAGLGGTVGIALAIGLTEWLVRGQELILPRQGDIRIGGIAVLFTLVLSVASGLGFGALAALHLLGGEHAQLLRGAGVQGAARTITHRLHHGLVVAQIALALTLLVGAGLLIDSFRRLSHVDPGFPTHHLLTLRVAMSEDKYDSDERIASFYDAVTETIRGLPGVVAASTTYSPAFLENDFRQTVTIEGRSQDDDAAQWVGTVIVGDRYFETSGVPIVTGRPLTASDRSGSPLVAVVNRTMANRFWPGTDPVGKRFRVDGGVSGSVGSLEDRFYTRDWITVVGVSGDERRGGLADAPTAEFYRPHAQMRWTGMSFLIRTTNDPSQSVSAIENAVWNIDANAPITDLRTMENIMSSHVAAPRWRTTLLTSFATLALLLASVGIYGVISYGVLQRVKEIGIRMALGAPGRRVRREVLGSGIRLALVGIVLGMGGAMGLARLLRSMLYEVTPFTLSIYLVAAAAMIAVAGLACYLPARRASSVDPLVALRD